MSTPSTLVIKNRITKSIARVRCYTLKEFSTQYNTIDKDHLVIGIVDSNNFFKNTITAHSA